MPRPYGLMFHTKGLGSVNMFPLNPDTCNWVDEFGTCIDPPTTLQAFQDLFGTPLQDISGSVGGGVSETPTGFPSPTMSKINQFIKNNQTMLLVGGVIGLLLFNRK